MASSNAGPITGGELVSVLQGDTLVLLTRPQMASLIAFAAIVTPRPLSRLTALTGVEAFIFVQGGQRVEFSLADFNTWLAGITAPETVPGNRIPTPFTGEERVLIRQGNGLVGMDLSQLRFLRGQGGSLSGVSTSPDTLLAPKGREQLISPVDGQLLVMET